jgi:hypothetical protein
MICLFATWPEVTYQGLVLTRMGARNRLISYFYLRDAPKDTLKRYAREGFVISRDMEGLVEALSPNNSGVEASAGPPEPVRVLRPSKKRNSRTSRR